MLVTETSASRPYSYVIKFSIAQMVAMKSDVITLVPKVNSSKRSGIQSYLHNLYLQSINQLELWQTLTELGRCVPTSNALFSFWKIMIWQFWAWHPYPCHRNSGSATAKVCGLF